MQPDLITPASDAPEPKLHVTTSVVRQMLRKRYEAPEWALMEEVAPNTGGGTRYADAIAVNLWSSRGHAIHGFEIKISRGDWLRELKDPAKADAIAGFCDHWFIVAPRGMIRVEELPPTWGLLEVRASGLVATKPAPKLEARPITRGFFASMMRRGFELIDQTAERKLADARLAMHGQIRDEVGRRVRESQSELTTLKKHLSDLKEKTGIDINQYSGPPAEVINLAKRLQHLGGYYSGGDGFGGLLQLAKNLEGAADTVRKAVAECGPEATKEGPAP